MGGVVFQVSRDQTTTLTSCELIKVPIHSIPASLMAAMFLYDAIRNNGAEEEAIMEGPVKKPYRRHRGADSLPNVITLSQQVSVMEEYAMEDKSDRFDCETNKMYFR